MFAVDVVEGFAGFESPHSTALRIPILFFVIPDFLPLTHLEGAFRLFCVLRLPFLCFLS